MKREAVFCTWARGSVGCGVEDKDRLDARKLPFIICSVAVSSLPDALFFLVSCSIPGPTCMRVPEFSQLADWLAFQFFVLSTAEGWSVAPLRPHTGVIVSPERSLPWSHSVLSARLQWTLDCC